MLSLIVAVLAYFTARYYIDRSLDDMKMPKGVLRGILLFAMSAACAYAAAYLVDRQVVKGRDGGAPVSRQP